jgi:adenylate kinase
MYDESIQRALRRHKIRPITLPAPLRDKLVEDFRSDAPVSHIITGTAGDGKTYHCREVWTELGGDVTAWNQGDKIQRLAVGDQTLVIVKDLSELRDDESALLISEFARDVADPDTTTFYLLAANHGQLLEKLKSAPDTPEVVRVSKVVEDLLVTGVSLDEAIGLRLSDLSRSPAAQMAMEIVEAITSHEGWSGCDSCSAQSDGIICPIYENRRRLIGDGADDPFKRRLMALIELSERNGSHFPVRQLLALAANSLLGHPDARDGLMTCADVPNIQSRGTGDRASIYRNIFGENLRPSKAEKTELFRKLNAFGIGAETSNRVDNLLVYGADDPAYAADYATLVLADPIYGATPTYVSAQRTYLEGADGTDRAAFLGALRSQRQRLFFTMPEANASDYSLWDLTVFRYAGLYLEVEGKITSGQPVPRAALNMVVRGLNRIFTGMLVQNQDELVLATSGSFSQSKRSPLLDELISVPRSGGEEVSIVTNNDGGAFSVSVKLVRGNEIAPVMLSLSPTRFEFLGRVAEGALPSSFSLECHEDLLAFKARLLRETENRRALDGDNEVTAGELVLRFIELNQDGRAQPRRVIVRV